MVCVFPARHRRAPSFPTQRQRVPRGVCTATSTSWRRADGGLPQILTPATNTTLTRACCKVIRIRHWRSRPFRLEFREGCVTGILPRSCSLAMHHRNRRALAVRLRSSRAVAGFATTANCEQVYTHVLTECKWTRTRGRKARSATPTSRKCTYCSPTCTRQPHARQCLPTPLSDALAPTTEHPRPGRAPPAIARAERRPA